MCVCVCVCERERERGRKKQKKETLRPPLVRLGLRYLYINCALFDLAVHGVCDVDREGKEAVREQ